MFNDEKTKYISQLLADFTLKNRALIINVKLLLRSIMNGNGNMVLMIKSALKRTKDIVVLCALATGLKPGAVFDPAYNQVVSPADRQEARC